MTWDHSTYTMLLAVFLRWTSPRKIPQLSEAICTLSFSMKHQVFLVCLFSLIMGKWLYGTYRVHAPLLSRVLLFVTPWTVALQAPLSMGFTGQNTGVGCHFLLHGNVSIQRLNLHPCVSCTNRQIFSFTTEPPGKGPDLILSAQVFWFFQQKLEFKILNVFYWFSDASN